MKRLKIWLNSFTLIQQYILISFVAIAIFIVVIFKVLNNGVDTFTNNQMINYLHRSQVLYEDAKKDGVKYDDTNAYNFMYYPELESYGSIIPAELRELVDSINPIIESEREDHVAILDDDTIAYSITKFENHYILSIIKTEYKEEFKDALISSVVNTTVIITSVIFILIMLWIYSLIVPLNSIRNYIQKIKNGENDNLIIRRNDEIGEVAEAVVTMNEELNKQQRIREEMIQNISHDLKTPIATIKSYSESIKDGVYPYDTLEKSVDVIIEHADRLEKKVYSLITYNKIGYLADSGEDQNILMSSVIEKAILSCSILRNDIVIDTDEVEYGIYFHGEEEAWRTAIENIIDNGLRYAKTKIKISLTDDLLEIYNDGELMDKDRLKKLFKPYEKGNKGNFGLGLSIVKKVCETYGYNIVGENRDDGVVFRIYRNKTK